MHRLKTLTPLTVLAALALLCALVLQSSCQLLPEPLEEPIRASGVRPVYIAEAEATIIRSEPPRPFGETGPFLIQGDTLYLVENFRGLHVVDNTDPSAPRTVAFISIPGCTSVASNGNILYVNNFVDLVTLDVSDVFNVSVLDRDANLYPEISTVPPDHFGFFECYDESRGRLGGWLDDELIDPSCYID